MCLISEVKVGFEWRLSCHFLALRIFLGFINNDDIDLFK